MDLIQKSLVIIKPDGLKRNLVGEIISRFERVGLHLVDCKLVQVDSNLAAAHYPVTDEWLIGVGSKTLGDCEKYGVDPMIAVGTNDPKEVGQLIHKYNQEYLMSGPVLAMIWEGSHAVELVRKLVGSTVPMLADPGTIRGDLASDSAVLANYQKRSIENLVHASGTVEEATSEIELWFS